MEVRRKSPLATALALFIFASCNAQIKDNANSFVGGGCEGCEAIFEYKGKELTSTDTLPGFQANEPKLKITGTVFKLDRRTPASDVILYIYHTDRTGVYATKGSEKGWGKRHGFIRGWVKTDADGKYSFYTFRPAPYPDRSEPEHIHLTVKEPDRNEYYLDDFVFDDDSLLTPEKIEKLKNRGGSGLMKPIVEGGILSIQRDIFLGHNIPGYD